MSQNSSSSTFTSSELFNDFDDDFLQNNSSKREKRRGGVGESNFQSNSQIESLNFYLENFKIIKTKKGKISTIKNIFKILQEGNERKIDFFNLISLGNFWKCYQTLNCSESDLLRGESDLTRGEKEEKKKEVYDKEVIFWFLVIAILILFKNTNCYDFNVLPSYVIAIINGLLSLSFKEEETEEKESTLMTIKTTQENRNNNSSSSSSSTSTSSSSIPSFPSSSSTNSLSKSLICQTSFCKKRKFISESLKNNSTHLFSSSQSTNQTSIISNDNNNQSRNDFLSKRKYSQQTEKKFENSSQIEQIASLDPSQVEIKSNSEGSVSLIWYEFTRILQLQATSFCVIKLEDLSFLTLFTINRYLNFLVTMITLHGDFNSEEKKDQQQLQQLDDADQQQQQQQQQTEELIPFWKILNLLKTSGSLRRISLHFCQIVEKYFHDNNVIELKESEIKKIKFKLWLHLGILESACYQSPLNQVIFTYQSIIVPFLLLKSSYSFCLLLSYRDTYLKKFQKKLNTL